MSAGRRSPANVSAATHRRALSSAARPNAESACAIAAPAWHGHTHAARQPDSCASSQSAEQSVGAIRNSAITAIATAFTAENMKTIWHTNPRVSTAASAGTTVNGAPEYRSGTVAHRCGLKKGTHLHIDISTGVHASHFRGTTQGRRELRAVASHSSRVSRFSLFRRRGRHAPDLPGDDKA